MMLKQLRRDLYSPLMGKGGRKIIYHIVGRPALKLGKVYWITFSLEHHFPLSVEGRAHGRGANR